MHTLFDNSGCTMTALNQPLKVTKTVDPFYT